MSSAQSPRRRAPHEGSGAPRITRAEYARLARMAPSEIERECELRAFRATGPGGQGVNTTDSAVRLRHIPTGIVVVSRASRSQHRNRVACLEKLRREFVRRSKTPAARVETSVPVSQKRRRLEAKRIQSKKKALRRRAELDS